MRIEFNTGNAAELTAVAALIASLRGEVPGVLLTADADHAALGETYDREAIDDAAANGYVPPLPVAPPTPPIAAPSPPVSVVPPPANGANVDADGLPWDNRIHSTPASLKKDGKWRGKRGLDDATRDAVTAELRAVMAAPAPVTDPLPPSEPPVDAATAFAAPVAAPVSEPVAVAPPPPPPAPVVAAEPIAPPPPPAPVAEPIAPTGALDFAGLMRKITGLQSAGRMTVGDSAEIAKSLGITGVRDLMHRPDLIPSFDALLPEAA